MRYDALTRAARTRHLAVLGGFHPAPGDDAPGDCKTLVLLGPDEPGFWPHLTASPEYRDGHPDPVDRWSRRVVNDWASELGATAVFPFGGPPYLPFYRWALRTGRIHASPVRLLVHDEAGLFVSFRAALAIDSHIDLPHPPPSPCDACAGQPCRTACPVDALDGAGYDVPACKTYLHSADGQTCMTQGCAVRRACPVSGRFGRLPAQSAYHMQQFREAE